MAFTIEDLDDPKNFRLLLTVPYKNLAEFVFEYLKKKSVMTILFWSVCLVFLCLTISIRIRIGHYFHYSHILFHSVLGMIILPILIIPIHEFLHIIPYYFSGARNIRIGMDLKQYLFYVTAHKYVASPVQFRIVAVTPFIIISAVLVFLIFLLPGLDRKSTRLN